MKAAEPATPVPANAVATAENLKPESVPTNLPVAQRDGKAIQSEPRVADPAAFYNRLLERVNQNQPVAPDALAQLGAQRANAIVAALTGEGIDPARAVATAPESGTSGIGKPVPVKLVLTAK